MLFSTYCFETDWLDWLIPRLIWVFPGHKCHFLLIALRLTDLTDWFRGLCESSTGTDVIFCLLPWDWLIPRLIWVFPGHKCHFLLIALRLTDLTDWFWGLSESSLGADVIFYLLLWDWLIRLTDSEAYPSLPCVQMSFSSYCLETDWLDWLIPRLMWVFPEHRCHFLLIALRLTD